MRFSPRNGEVILKAGLESMLAWIEFQSPQWGSNSKVGRMLHIIYGDKRFSPRNGEVILKLKLYIFSHKTHSVSVPAMGK